MASKRKLYIKVQELMNVLKPELLWIERRCYRINECNSEDSAFHEHDMYQDVETYKNVDDEGDNDDFEVTMIDSSRYSTMFHVSKHYIGSIIGKKGINKSRIEHDTKTEIKIPRQGQTGNIVIFGPSPSNVKAARRRINIIVISSRIKQRPTHFISLPMNNPTVMQNYDVFKETVLRECPSRGLEESLFIGARKLHLTVGVMCLMDSEERLQASKLLREAKQDIIMPILQGCLPLKLRLKGLSYMNDDPREIDVLYGRVQESGAPPGTLQKLADALVEHFNKAGFMSKEFGREHVKLHVTLINSKYRQSSDTNITNCDETQSRNKKSRETFDGSAILEKFSDYDFGVAEVKEIHLCQRHSSNDGYYQNTSVLVLQ